MLSVRKESNMNDSIVISQYVLNGITADRIVSDPARLQAFTDAYKAVAHQQVSTAEMGKRLLNLRKRGASDGGLPRLVRV